MHNFCLVYNLFNKFNLKVKLIVCFCSSNKKDVNKIINISYNILYNTLQKIIQSIVVNNLLIRHLKFKITINHFKKKYSMLHFHLLNFLAEHEILNINLLLKM
jgi:hypothetical protein